MKPSLIGGRGVGIALAQTVHEGVGHFVSDNVVRETTENGPAARSRKVSEHKGFIPLRIEGVGVGEGMRGDLELVTGETPTDAAAECELKPSENAHGDRINILGMEFRIVQ